MESASLDHYRLPPSPRGQAVAFQEGLARWDGLSQDPKPSGFSTAVQTHALPADYGSFPEWLSILFVEEFSGPGEGKGPG